MEKVAVTRYEASRLVQLPTELTIEIASCVAAQSEDAMADLVNLRATCKAMCVVCSAAKVGRCLALRRVLQRRFYLGPEYRAMLITGLATVGNPEACFRSGMCLVFGKQRGAIMPCLDPLRCTAEAGHKVAIYVLALLLYRPNSGDGDDDEARQLLRMVEGPEAGAQALPWNNNTCKKCHCRIILVLWDLASLAVCVPTPVPRLDNHQCVGRGCGEHAGWYAWYSWRRLCSEECRICNECDWFFYIVMEALNEKNFAR
jgi:hypothetical protein